MRRPATQSLGRLRRLGKRIFTTADAALCLEQTPSAATRTLGRLAKAGLVHAIRRGLWSLERDLDPLLVPEHLTAPLPAYVSFYTALHVHGMISQVPQAVYAASLAPTRRVRTALGEFSIHRIAPTFFGGFETSNDGVRLARPAKALLDTLYLAPGRSRLFAALPEVEIPRGFSRHEARRWLEKLRLGPRRLMMEQRLRALLRG